MARTRTMGSTRMKAATLSIVDDNTAGVQFKKAISEA